MTKRTNAFNTLQGQVQSTFDFAVVVCHAVPALKLQMKLLDDGKISKLPEPDYFEANNPTSKLREQANGYKDKLATYLFLSSFSFFESYVGCVLKEVFQFNLAILSEVEIKSRLGANTNTSAKKALNGGYDQRHLQRYTKYSKELIDNGYILPNKLITSIALESLNKTVNELKANQIPDFLANYLRLDITEDTKNTFGTYRQLRNDIAHGDNPSINFSKVKKANGFLRKFATIIDEHLVEHFMLPSNFKI